MVGLTGCPSKTQITTKVSGVGPRIPVAVENNLPPYDDEPSKPGGDPAKRIAADKVLELPFIFWGGDGATFHANGGLETTPDSLFGKQGLKLKLVPGDDFEFQPLFAEQTRAETQTGSRR